MPWKSEDGVMGGPYGAECKVGAGKADCEEYAGCGGAGDGYGIDRFGAW